MSIRVYLLATLVLGMALALLSHFASVWIFRDFTIDEPNLLILTGETVMMFGIMCFSLFCIFGQLAGPKSAGAKKVRNDRGFGR